VDNGAERKSAPHPVNPPEHDDIEPKCAAAIAVITNDLDYHHWLEIGMALHSGFNGGAEGFAALGRVHRPLRQSQTRAYLKGLGVPGHVG
jgi:hypothetical protein